MEKEKDLSIIDESIQQKIFLIRGCKVMIDADIATLYQTNTRLIVQAVQRNLDRFPVDFMFQLTNEEYDSLRSQIEISKKGRGGRRYLPYVFTEHGVVMLSSVLNNEVAILMNILIVRAFIKMRESLDNYKDIVIKIGKIELKQNKDSDVLYRIHEVIKHLLETPLKQNEKIGFNLSKLDE